MWGHSANCNCAVCACFPRIFYLISARATQPGYSDFLVTVAQLLRTVEAELRDHLARERPLPAQTEPPAAAPQAAGVPGETPGVSQPPGPPSETPPLLLLASKASPPLPPPQGRPAEKKAPLKPVKTEPAEEVEDTPETGVKELPAASPGSRARSSGRRRREASKESRGVQHRREHRSRERSRRRRRRDSRSRGDKRTPKPEEERGRERKSRPERPPEPDHPPPGRGGSVRPREPSHPPPGRGWIGPVPKSDHYRWSQGTNKGVVKRAKQERWIFEECHGSRTWGEIEMAPPEREADEMEKLRALQKQAQDEDKGAEKRKDKKDKQKRKRRDEARGEEGREGGPPKQDPSEVEAGQKSLDSVFGGTGLDPDPVKRQKILKKAKRLGKSKKKKKKRKSSDSEGDPSSTTSTSSSSSMGKTGRGLFEDENKLTVLWKKYPGALTSGAAQEARHRLMSQAGTLWNLSEGGIPPLFTQYSRQQVLANASASPALQQELLTIAQALDFALMGKMAAMADILCQRIKSLEAIIKGSHWSFAREMELVRNDQFTMAEDSEALQAARRAREGDRLRSLLTRAPGTKGGDGKTRKGAGKNTSKGKSDEGGKGRGNEQRPKDDGRGGRKP
eukprot:s2827_g4.t1